MQNSICKNRIYIWYSNQGGNTELTHFGIGRMVGMVQCTIGTFGYFYNHDTRKGPKAPKVLFQNSHLYLPLVLGSITYYIILEGF